MSAPLSHKANVVAELQSRLAEAINDDDADFLAGQLVDAGSDLERACLAGLRAAREAEAHAEALKSIIADNKSRKDRLETKAEKIRAAVAQALQDAGLPGIKSPDMTVSLRQKKPHLVIDREPTIADHMECLAEERVSYKWDTDAVRSRLEAGDDIVSMFARMTNGSATVQVRAK